MRCAVCGQPFLYTGTMRDTCSVRCHQRQVNWRLVDDPPQLPVLGVALSLRRATHDAQRIAARLNRVAAQMADVLCADDEPWSTDEPAPDLRHLWDTGTTHRGRFRGERRYGAWADVR